MAMNTSNAPIDPADVLKNPGNYLLDGAPISRVELWVNCDELGTWYRSGPDSKKEMDNWARITRRPRTRTVKARRYWKRDSTSVFVATQNFACWPCAPCGSEWVGPEFDMTVEE